MKISEIIGLNIKKLRTDREISQEKLAEISDLDRTYIQSIEKGKRNISVLVLLKISKALNIEVTKLLEGTEDEL